MKYLAYILFVVVALSNLASIGVVSTAHAIEDQFTISQEIDSAAVDTEKPTVPQNLVATAISSTQIDLSWDASTDNDSVAGYQIFRDLLFIATSTLTTYSDTALTSETLYAYTVTAFDPSFNYSTTSATSTATTLGVPVEQGGNGSSGSLLPLKLEYFSVFPSLYSALINVETNIHTQAVVSWGLTPDYELGTLAQTVFATEHTINIEGLTPGTLYYFKIELTDAYGRTIMLADQKFTTTALPSAQIPLNVTNLRATGDEQVITLTWNNPQINFDSVRIVRSELFYPKDLVDGKVVYEGSAEKFVDTDVVYGKTYYYTVFAKDVNGNYSSGAVTKGQLYKVGEPTKPDDLFGGVVELPLGSVHPLIAKLSVLDIDFFQNGKKLEKVAGHVQIDGDRELLISIAYEKVPEILKTIAITMRDPQDPTKTFSFLLRVNKDKTAYEALIAPLGRSGNFEFGVSILDYKNQGLKKLAGVIVSVMPLFSVKPGAAWFSSFGNILSLIVAILLVLVGVYLWYRRHEKNN